ncbi:Uu.00g019650.m01.CDS01 [Anthostomella pinea]|uniref:Uu.00g019650.m01.CDS01 n=1 Tax=Anthostomella pinea TaxID=933095 RepID=A0AAI8VZC7_9PEZI|nr:Uu.00g019650.m01.CDS01 [Anthostomella pinea]
MSTPWASPKMASTGAEQINTSAIEAAIVSACNKVKIHLAKLFDNQLVQLRAEFDSTVRALVNTSRPRPVPVIPDPALLGGPSHFKVWLLSLEGKLSIDGDALGTPEARAYYVFSRLEPTLQEVVVPHLVHAKATQTWDYQAIIDVISRNFDESGLSKSESRVSEPSAHQGPEKATAPSVDSSQETDTKSDSSTLVYSHEPFATFQQRVVDFARKHLWVDAAPGDIKVERLKGGSYNRVIGLARQAADQPDKEVQYILRVPRLDADTLDRDVATLRFLQRHTSISAPRVITFDETRQNELGLPYMIQNRIPGADLADIYSGLSHKGRCRVARELGSFYRQMLAIRSSMAGHFMLSVYHEDLEAPLYITPFEFNDRTLSRLEATDPSGTWLQSHFCTMASELDEKGWFSDVPNCLAHLDLEPRNIIFNSGAVEESSAVSVLDWDKAILGPMFMACAPPLWIWGWLDDEEENKDEDERTANDDPPTPEALELKHLFEEAAGPEYRQFAYEPAYRFARRLVLFAVNGVRSKEHDKEAEAMLEEWANFCYDEG